MKRALLYTLLLFGFLTLPVSATDNDTVTVTVFYKDDSGGDRTMDFTVPNARENSVTLPIIVQNQQLILSAHWTDDAKAAVLSVALSDPTIILPAGAQGGGGNPLVLYSAELHYQPGQRIVLMNTSLYTLRMRIEPGLPLFR